ncbi:hypothetical protein CEK29_08240 [Bordetella genomosp. 5]|uniref:restriction endonuclease n=1 Tax=Bordetella genomosp. 5 TaxID=1395608 RepID=UPI000B9E8366|nr:restriction endonuclease [Bordetella genomosp. 5]OZI44686.1 hypothetical protein CEK29_08240 [Bordetella genomosp. 5]
MKLKMAKNSIFAVLLRSSWWMSAGVALLLCVGGFAVLPRDFAAMGVFAAVPFAVIAIIAGYKQAKRPSEARIEVVVKAVATLHWDRFRPLVEGGFMRDGCEVRHLNTPGADFALTKDGNVALVSARRWKIARVGVEHLRELQALREQQGAREAIFITLGDVSDNAWQYARQHDVAIMRAPELAQLLRHHKF